MVADTLVNQFLTKFCLKKVLGHRGLVAEEKASTVVTWFLYDTKAYLRGRLLQILALLMIDKVRFIGSCRLQETRFNFTPVIRATHVTMAAAHEDVDVITQL